MSLITWSGGCLLGLQSKAPHIPFCAFFKGRPHSSCVGVNFHLREGARPFPLHVCRPGHIMLCVVFSRMLFDAQMALALATFPIGSMRPCPLLSEPFCPASTATHFPVFPTILTLAISPRNPFSRSAVASLSADLLAWLFPRRQGIQSRFPILGCPRHAAGSMYSMNAADKLMNEWMEEAKTVAGTARGWGLSESTKGT